MLLALTVFSAGQSTAQSEVESIGVFTVGTDPMGDTGHFGSINGKSHQNDAILSHNGWQYTAYYNNESPRRIVMARRKLPYGNWQKFVFRDYAQTTNDGHNVICLGKSPEDGTLHMAFDHHGDHLNYRRSVTGLLDDPESKDWSASRFGSVTDTLGDDTLTGVTYPIFVTSPSGKLYLSRRIGSPRDGDQLLYEYAGGAWTTIGKYIESDNHNAYMDNLYISPDARMHAAWIWRNGPLPTAHDICYAYSDDNGRTWYSSDGKKVGTTNEGAMSRLNNPELTVVPISPGKLLNQQGMTVDAKGRPHIVHSLNNRVHHFYRDDKGKWHTIDCGFSRGGSRSSIAADAMNNVYIMFEGLQIAMATEDENYTDWTIVNQEFKGKYTSEPVFDRYRLKTSDILSVYMAENNYRSIQVIDFLLNADTPPDTR